MAQFELSEKKYKNGRRPFTAILYELQPPDCVDSENEVGTKFNKNGITFLEEYCQPQLSSIKDMSVTVEFVDENRTQILGHGMTGVEDGMPTFDNATVVGHFTEGYITETTIDNELKKVVAGKGYLDEMRYHDFVASLENDLNNGNSVDGSIEIYKSEGNDAIIYKYGWKEKGRIPTDFIHSGWTMVLNPADTTSTLVELNSKKENKEENKNMEFNMDEVKSVIKSTISECNDNSEKLNQTITELNETITQKDAVIAEKESKIVELNATVEQVQKALDDLKKEHETYWAEREALEKELGELKAKARIGELNSAIENFSDEEKKYAESEINSFNDDPVNGNIDAIVSKIYAGIGQASKKVSDEARTAEQNAVQESKNEVIDIFSEMCTEAHTNEDEDTNIF